jgi:glutaminase
MTPDGRTTAVGDVDHEFPIESISKVFTLALVIEERGHRAVRAKLGANPTGAAFDSVVALELHHDKPTSPLVNAGAMATTSFVPAADPADRSRKILDIQSAFAGRPLSISEEINASEQETNSHNKAIAWLLYSAGTLFCDPMDACAVYTQQCSTMLNTTDLATMGATLAAGGVNPRTGVRVMTDSNVRYVLAEMVMEGMYTQSGDWAYAVGVPAKSGVGGGVLAVVPGRLAVAAFSPKLNSAGNSVRGWFAVADVVNRLKLGLFDARFKE